PVPSPGRNRHPLLRTSDGGAAWTSWRFGRVAAMITRFATLLATVVLAAPARAGAEGTPSADVLARALAPVDGFASRVPLAVASTAGVRSAAASPFRAPPPAPGGAGAPRPSRWGFSASLGYGGSGGDFGGILKDPVAGDYNMFRAHGAWRFGLGVSFSS